MLPKFITIEGVDGVGKTTACMYVSQYLKEKGYDSITVPMVKDTLVNDKIREILKRTEAKDISSDTYALLFCAGIKDSIDKFIKPALEDNRIVVSDRFTISARVFQNDCVFIDRICNIVESEVTPDITFILDATPDVIKQRLENRGHPLDVMEDVDDDTIAERRTLYLKHKNHYGSNGFIVDVAVSVREVEQQIKSILDKFFP